MSKHTKHHNRNGEVGNNFQVVSHLSIRICRNRDLRCGDRDLRCRNRDLNVSNNRVTSTIYLFSRFHQNYVDVVLCQNTQNIITFMVRWEIFSHLTMKVFRDLEHQCGPE